MHHAGNKIKKIKKSQTKFSVFLLGGKMYSPPQHKEGEEIKKVDKEDKKQWID